MKKLTIVSLFLFLILFLLSSVSSAVVPTEINYQGFLKDNANNLLSGIYKMTFRIFTSLEAGNIEWTEVHPAVEVNNGLYNVRLGSISPIDSEDFDGTAKYLEVEVNDEKMSPRVPLISVPYALQAEQLAPKILEVLNDTILIHNQNVVFVDASSSTTGVYITLPSTLTPTNGKVYYIYKIDTDTSKPVFVSPNPVGDKINGSVGSISISQQWSCIRVVGHKKNEWIANVEDAFVKESAQISGTTPSVSGGNYFEVVNSPGTPLPALYGGVAGQVITLVFRNNNTTVVRDYSSASNIYLSGGTDWINPGTNDVLQLVCDGTYWYEISRSNN